MSTANVASRLFLTIASICCAALSSVAVGADVYAVLTASRLEILDGEIPKTAQWRNWRVGGEPWISVEGAKEAYIAARPTNAGSDNTFQLQVAIRLANPRDVEGKAFIVKENPDDGFQIIRFKVPSSEFKADEKEFLQVRLGHYSGLQGNDLAGAAWFRHQVRQTSKSLGLDLKSDLPTARLVMRGDTDTIDLFTGGRAVSENLQLDRVLPTSKPSEESVALSKIEGITIKEFDWTKLLGDAKPETDPLARIIPSDQHALFFPKFDSLVEAIELANRHGSPILHLTESRGESALTQDRFQRQLCLPLGQLERIVGPQLIADVAITGGDPYFRTVTDIAVLFNSKAPDALFQALQARLAQQCAQSPEVLKLDGEISGVRYIGARSTDRSVCSYVAKLGNTVVVTNSPHQLGRLVAVHKDPKKSLAEQLEYKFFRNRYQRADESELAFLILTDQTIRRWCGPKWRIASARRTRAAGLLSEVQAEHAEAIIRKQVKPEEVSSEFWLSDGERHSLAARGATSTVYGNLEFQTPIGELEFDLVTAEEARLYERWRNTYQQNWSNFFDPIAIRLEKSKDKLGVDVTVMPLINNTEYRQYISVSKGAKVGDGGDPHPEALVHGVLALNPESELLKQYGALGSAFAPQIKVNPLSWLGNWIAIYADQDPIWEEAAQAKSVEEFLSKNYFRLPIAVHIDVKNGLKLTAFLAGVRSFIEQSAPGMTVWENLEHREIPYVKISSSPRGRGVDETLAKLALYYAPSGKSLIVTSHEGVLKRALDRQIDGTDKDGANQKRSAGSAWLGENIGLRLTSHFHHLFASLRHESYQRSMQRSSWSNIPILNEWKRIFPEMDPVAVHEKLWGRRLICPSGEYRWNDTWKTMESTVYGHPGEPRKGPLVPPILLEYAMEDFGLTFEENGLRAKVELTPGK